jgi:hypothetical protein
VNAKHLALAAVAAFLIAGCSSPPAAHMATAAAADGQAAQCAQVGGTWSNGTCTAVAPTLSQTDRNGQQCTSLDSLGYCPGDDPSPMQQWCGSTGYDSFQSVQTDLSQLGQDAGDDDLGAVEQDGATLAQDASSIESALPPLSNVHKVTFGVWMGYMSLAGIKASQGDIGGASSLTEDATQYNSIVTYVSNQCGGN